MMVVVVDAGMKEGRALERVYKFCRCMTQLEQRLCRFAKYLFHPPPLSLFLSFLPFPSPLNIYNDVIWFVSRGKKFEKESSGW